MKRFCDEMKRIRVQRKMSQKDLSKKSGVSQQSISRIEAEINSPTEETMNLIAAALGLTLPDILSEEESNSRPFVLLPEEQNVLQAWRNANEVYRAIALKILQDNQKPIREREISSY